MINNFEFKLKRAKDYKKVEYILQDLIGKYHKILQNGKTVEIRADESLRPGWTKTFIESSVVGCLQKYYGIPVESWNSI